MHQGIDPSLALQLVREAPFIVLDVETTGLDVRAKACGYVITNEDHSLYSPVRHEAGGNIPNPEEFEIHLANAFAERTRLGLLTIGHNLGFDLRVCGRHGIFPSFPLEDTMLNEALIDDTTRGYGLDECCIRRRVTPKRGDELYRAISQRFGGMPDRKSMDRFWRMPGDNEIVVDYATGDGISTIELWDAQQELIDDEGLRKVHRLECQLLHRVARMHIRGLKIDGEYADSLLSPSGHISSAIRDAESKFTPGFNTNSPKDVENLYRANGFSDADFARTDQGKASFTERWLATNEIGEAILAVRRLKKARDSFAVPLAQTHNINGRVHAVLNQSKSDEYGVAGARFSCSEPNLQAFPKRNKVVGRLVRRLVVSDSGYEIEEADAKQQEPRLFAYFSDDERLLAGYRSGTIDIHDISSAGLGLHRDVAKRLGLGILTGMSAGALAGHMGWSHDRAQEYHNAFLAEQFPAIKQFQQDAKSIFRSSGYVKSVLGRKARLDDARYAYRAVSRIIQNSGGDHIKTCLLRACQYSEACRHSEVEILMTIHDSLIWQKLLGFDSTELIRILENVPYERDFNLGVPIPFEVGTGTDWAMASYGSK